LNLYPLSLAINNHIISHSTWLIQPIKEEVGEDSDVEDSVEVTEVEKEKEEALEEDVEEEGDVETEVIVDAGVEAKKKKHNGSPLPSLVDW